jgi:hypothetical protein
MCAHLLPTQVLVSRAVECLILSGDNLMLLVVEGVHVLLELEIHWAFIDSALVVLEQVLVVRLLELGLAVLLDVGREL